MPYPTTASLPPAVKNKLKGKKRRQWMHVWNSEFKSHGDETRAFASAWAAVKKGKGMAKSLAFGVDSATFSLFLPLSKIEKNKDGSCTVSGYASTPSLDLDGEIVSLDAVKKALPGYWLWRNVREMHQPSAVGVAKEANVDDTGLFLTSKITDTEAVKKCLEEVYKGYSIGGRKLAKDGNVITEIELIEVSLVDRPANPDCRISIAKRAKDLGESAGYLLKVKTPRDPNAKALAKMSQVVEILVKSGPPAAHDGFSLPAKRNKPKVPPKSPLDADDTSNITRKSGPCEAHGVENCEECAQKRDVKTGERESLASQGDALPDGSFPIKNKEDLNNARRLAGKGKNPGKARALIRRRAKELGVKLPDKWKKKEAKKLIKAEESRRASVSKAAEVADFLGLDKSMRSVGSLSYAFDSIRDTQRSLMMEAKQEGGDKKDGKLAKDLGSIASQLATVISQKAEHEGAEATDLSDADDQWVRSLLEGDEMSEKAATGTNSDLDQAIVEILKRAAAPSRGQRMEMCKADLAKARKARKSAMEEIRKAHAMHKSAFLAKAAKKDKKPDDDGDFDHAGAMEKLQKAAGQLNAMKTFIKAAESQLEKVGRSGQRGQEAADGDAFYQVPPGVKDLTPDSMATAGPGSKGGGSMPPEPPDAGQVFPGKFARNGLVPVEVAEIMAENAMLKGQVAALDRMGTNRQRPHNFNVAQAFGQGQPERDKNAVLYEGVDANALNSTEDHIRGPEVARIAGNYLLSGQTFGKSLLDPSFRGMAGAGK